jgi:3-deoxy-7-phosphoheptulonate synthase
MPMTTMTPSNAPGVEAEAGSPMDWSPTSWQSKPAKHQPAYRCPAELDRVVQQLSMLPPLVTSWEIESLKTQLARAARGQGFLLQGGDCAESFEECESGVIASKLKILLQMSMVLVHGTCKPVIRVGRFAGQYAKPRSDETETRGDTTLPSYRGDLINAVGFTASEREPEPQLMLRAYERAALTLNFIRGLIDGGFADLHHPEYWDLGFVKHSPRAAEYQRMVESLGEALRFLETLAGASVSDINRVDFFTSHDALHLPYEQAQTRQVPRRKGWYNLSTHLPWVGMRTAGLDGAHVEYFRGIRNPIAVKIGPSMTPQWLRGLLDVLHPDDEPGHLTLTHRLGAERVADHLPSLIEAVRASGKTVLWCCDPMHGNTHFTASGVKTRNFDHILSEIEQSFEIHHRLGTYLGGVHFELTGENVTECVGGARGLTEADLSRAYKTQVDPRLNYEQALEMAMLVARRVAEINGNRSGA